MAVLLATTAREDLSGSTQGCESMWMWGSTALGKFCDWKVAYLNLSQLLNWMVLDLAVKGVEQSPIPILSQ